MHEPDVSEAAGHEVPAARADGGRFVGSRSDALALGDRDQPSLPRWATTWSEPSNSSATTVAASAASSPARADPTRVEVDQRGAHPEVLVRRGAHDPERHGVEGRGRPGRQRRSRRGSPPQAASARRRRSPSARAAADAWVIQRSVAASKSAVGPTSTIERAPASSASSGVVRHARRPHREPRAPGRARARTGRSAAPPRATDPRARRPAGLGWPLDPGRRPERVGDVGDPTDRSGGVATVAADASRGSRRGQTALAGLDPVMLPTERVAGEAQPCGGRNRRSGRGRRRRRRPMHDRRPAGRTRCRRSPGSDDGARGSPRSASPPGGGRRTTASARDPSRAVTSGPSASTVRRQSAKRTVWRR